MKEVFQQGLAVMGIVLGADVVEKQLQFLDELLRWNKKINLTSVRNKKEAVEKHLLDSLSVLGVVDGRSSLLDVGSGGGLPGIPLAIADSRLIVTSVDSVGKKINFQKHIKRMLHLNNFRAEHTRIEELTSRGVETGFFDVAVTRAFSSLESIFTLVSPWVASSGKIVAMKGPEGEEEMNGMTPHLEAYGIDRLEICRHQLPFSKAERHIIIAYKK
jgi:16S rRNA (guanine527-N7)-methyltransferase